MLMMLSLFRKKDEKWHHVRWRNGPRRLFLALQFTAQAVATPLIERIAPSTNGAVQPDDASIVREILTAIDEYNRKNLCALKVARIRYRANASVEAADHGTATRKLLNLL